MTNEQNKISARRIVEESWNKHNTKLLDELFSNDAICTTPRTRQSPRDLRAPRRPSRPTSRRSRT